MLVVVGEFNAGKSANALLGRPVLRVGVTPTTAAIQIRSRDEVFGQGLVVTVEGIGAGSVDQCHVA